MQPGEGYPPTMSALRAIRILLKNPERVRHLVKVRQFKRQKPELAQVIHEVRERRLTFLSPENLVDLARVVVDADRNNLQGGLIEAGTALGGSAIVLARSKKAERPMWVFDGFGLIPPPSSKDGPDVHARYEEIVSGQSRGIDDDVYYGYRDDLLSEVTANFHSFGVDPEEDAVTFVKGYYEETIPGAVTFPVAVAHLDCDWYDSLMICLREIEPRLVVGGRFVIDDYYSWSGCTRAIDEFFAGRNNYRWQHESRLHLIKLSN